MAVWHMVQAWYFWAWLWNDGIPGAGASTVSVWHSRQSRFTWLRFNNLGLLEPCGVWQATQPSILTGACSQERGPDLWVWQPKHPWSWAAVERSCLGRNPPCWLWQLVQTMSPSFTRWWKGLEKSGFTSRWQL